MRILGACMRSGWVQSMRLLGACIWRFLGACMRILGACIWKRLGACMRFLGAKYAETFGCKVCGCWVHVYGDVWVQSICLLGASLIRLIACLIVGSLPDSRWLHSPRVSYILGPGAPGPNNQNNQEIKQFIKLIKLIITKQTTPVASPVGRPPWAPGAGAMALNPILTSAIGSQ